MFLSILYFLPAGATKLTLSEAIKNGSVKVSFSGYHDTSRTIFSSHYGKSILLSISNSMKESLSLDLESGFQLIPNEDERYQKMVVTASEIINLKPNQSMQKPLYAMCCESGDASPTSTSGYLMGNLVEHDLLGLVKLIEKNKLQDNSGQSAIWVLTNNSDILDVISTDVEKCSLLRKYLCQVKNLDFQKYDPKIHGIMGGNEQHEIVYNPVMHTFKSEVVYKSDHETKATLVIIDENDQLVETLFADRQLRVGKYTYTVELTTSNYDENKIYFMRMFADGRVVVEKSIMVKSN